jgi:ornithine carbamoyltransferase
MPPLAPNTQHFLDLSAIPPTALRAILTHARARKQARYGLPKGRADPDAPLAGYTLAMVFEKSSTRTRVSFEQAMRQLGGSSIVLEGTNMQLGRGETIADTARVLSGYVDAIMLRTSGHDKLEALAHEASVPVINGLTDRSHPCQLLADILTYEEARGSVAGTRWAWLGDGNNVANTLIEAAGLFGFHVDVATPPGYEPDPFVVEDARKRGAHIVLTPHADSAVAGVDVVVTDTWISMGQSDSQEKLAAMFPYQVTKARMALARQNAIFFHCLPAHRGEEVEAGVMDGPQSLVWAEAENRLHVQKAILLWCLGKLA